jgi:hypothetical protein
MKVDQIKLAFNKNIALNSENTISAYIQLPVGVWVIGDKKYTVSEYIEGEGTDYEYRTTKIDLIEDATVETPVV